MWILDKYGAAVDLSKMAVLRCDSDHAPFAVEGWWEIKEFDRAEYYRLADFETRAEAKAYIAELVSKLNAEGDNGKAD